jgi:hypothetical protein
MNEEEVRPMSGSQNDQSHREPSQLTSQTGAACGTGGRREAGDRAGDGGRDGTECADAGDAAEP